MVKKTVLLVVWLFFLCRLSQAVDLTGALATHDPSRILKDGSRYWFFMTGNGIPASFSDNLTSWRMTIRTVFPAGAWPDWIDTAVPDFEGNFWAPDMIYMNHAYYLYYSCSSWGSSRSAIGVARTASLNTPEWTDLGMVVSSNGTSTAINAIDPGLYKDDDGKVYMVYGSWFGGIGMVEIDTITGLAITSTTHLYGGSHQSIEAANLIREGSYYYLIVNRGNCCQGVNSTYYMVAGRSESVSGPYSGFGTILATDGRYIGPGHFSPLYDSCATFASIHFYDKNAGGASKLDILKLDFYDGWPKLNRDFTFANCGASGIGDGPAAAGDSPLQIFPNPADNDQFTITLPGEFKNETLRVEIYGLDGRQLYNEEFTGVATVNPELSLRKGIYMVQVKNGRRSYRQKLVIQ